MSICSSTSDEFDDYLEPLLVEKVDDYTQAEISGHDLNLEIRLFESESPPSSHRHISNLSEDKKYQVQVKKLEVNIVTLKDST